MTSATPSYGTLLKMGDGADPEVFTTIAEVGDLEAPGIELETEDATSHDSGGWEEKIATILKISDIDTEINWIPSDGTHDETTGLLSKILGRTKTNFQVILPNAALTFPFSAYVTKFQPKQPVKGKLSADITFSGTGSIVPA